MNLGFYGGRQKRVFWCWILTFVFGVAFGLLSVTAASTTDTEAQEVPDEILIENKIYRTDRKGSVYFTHTEHAEGYVEECSACHHDYQNGQNVWQEGQTVQKCSACHDPSKRDGRVRKLNIAYHKNCKGCHQKLAREGGTKAPYRQCKDCHSKRD